MKAEQPKKVTGPYLAPLAPPQVSFLDHWEEITPIFGATGIKNGTCRPLFYTPQVSNMDHTYLSHPQKLFICLSDRREDTGGSMTSATGRAKFRRHTSAVVADPHITNTHQKTLGDPGPCLSPRGRSNHAENGIFFAHIAASPVEGNNPFENSPLNLIQLIPNSEE